MNQPDEQPTPQPAAGPPVQPRADLFWRPDHDEPDAIDRILTDLGPRGR